METKQPTHRPYGLKNAADLLNRIRHKYSGLKEDPPHHNATFIEQSIELEEIEPLKPKQQPIEKQQKSLSLVKQTQQSNTFCDQLILQILQQKLAIYRQDLLIMQQNKDELIDTIQLLSDRIQKLKDIEANNIRLAFQNENLTLQLHNLMQQYHQSNQIVFKNRINQHQNYDSLRRKVRNILKETTADRHYLGFLQHWNQHVYTLKVHRNVIQNASKQQVPQSVPIDKVKQVQEESSFDPPKKQVKKFTEAEKAMLLGDLKSFSKNFKFPSN